MTFENKDKCLVCKSDSLNNILKLNEFPLYFGALPKDKVNICDMYPLTICKCGVCGHVQQIDSVDEAVMNKVYEAEYYNCPSPEGTGMGVSEIEKFRQFFKDVKPAVGKVLEIGCYDGYLLNKFEEEGWDVYGIDPSDVTAQIVNSYEEGKIVNGFFDENSFEDKQFDMIVFRNLLEHIYDLETFLKSVSKKLVPGGHVFIDVPNVKKYSNVGGMGCFFHQHISYFSIESLTTLLNQCGFAVEESFEGSPNMFVYAKWIDKINKEKSSAKPANDLILNVDSKKEAIKGLFDRNDSVILFGASIICTTLSCYLPQESKKKIKCIFDNDLSKHGRYIYNCQTPISKPTTPRGNHDAVLILTWIFADEIEKQLIELGYDKTKILRIDKIEDYLLEQEAA